MPRKRPFVTYALVHVLSKTFDLLDTRKSPGRSIRLERESVTERPRNGRDAFPHRRMECLEQRQLGKIFKKLEAAVSEGTLQILQRCGPPVRLVESQDHTQRPVDRSA